MNSFTHSLTQSVSHSIISEHRFLLCFFVNIWSLEWVVISSFQKIVWYYICVTAASYYSTTGCSRLNTSWLHIKETIYLVLNQATFLLDIVISIHVDTLLLGVTAVWRDRESHII